MLIGSTYNLTTAWNVNWKYIQSDMCQKCQLEINTTWPLVRIFIGSKYNLTPARMSIGSKYKCSAVYCHRIRKSLVKEVFGKCPSMLIKPEIESVISNLRRWSPSIEIFLIHENTDPPEVTFMTNCLSEFLECCVKRWGQFWETFELKFWHISRKNEWWRLVSSLYELFVERLIVT